MNLHLLQLEPARALGWALIHFLWQGTVVAALFKLALRSLKRKSSQTRYLAGCCGLGLLLLCPIFTYFVLAYPTDITGTSTSQSAFGRVVPHSKAPTAIGPDLVVRVAGQRQAALAAIPGWVDAQVPWVLRVWIAGVLVLSSRLAAGWWRVRRMASDGLLADEAWRKRLNRAAGRLGVNRSVKLMRSALVHVPTALGWLQPVVLLPMTALTGLAASDLESILAHELAHVRRHDYLINLLQCVVETLLFYHPAVWWISNQIRVEREHACDELVVAAYGDPIGYAHALTNLESLCRVPDEQFALSAAGGSLVERVRRLIGQPPTNPTSAGWIFGMTVPVAFAFWLLAVRSDPAAAVALPASQPVVRTEIPAMNQNAVPLPKPRSDPGEATSKPSEEKKDGKSRSLNSESGPVSVRATSEDLDAVESPVPAANRAAPQVMIEVKFTELSPADIKEIGLSSFLADRAANQNPSAVQIQITNRNGVITQPVPGGKDTGFDTLFDNPGLRNVEQVTYGIARTIADGQFRTIVRALEKRMGVDVLAAPRVTTLSGRQARIEVMDLKQVVTGVSISTDSQNKTTVNYLRSDLPSGPAVDVFPEVLADGKTIRLKIVPSWREFLGYDQPDSPVVVGQGSISGTKTEPLEVQRPLPHFQVRQTMADISVRDGETIVISGLGALRSSAKTPALRTMKGIFSKPSPAPKGQLIIFVTPVILDSAGKRTRAE